MIKLEVGVPDKIRALCLPLRLPAYFTAKLIKWRKLHYYYFFPSEFTCNYCHTPVTPCHPRQESGGKGDDVGEEEGEEVGEDEEKCRWEQQESSSRRERE